MSVFTQEFYALQNEYKTNTEFRNRLGKCQLCHQSISDRQVTLYKGLIDALYRVYCWLGQHRRHEFYTREIKQLLGKNEYARFGDLDRFGGLIYNAKNKDGKFEKSYYGLNMQRAKEFFAGERQIPIQITLNQLTNEIIEAKYVSIHEFPELYELLTKEGLYDYAKLF